MTDLAGVTYLVTGATAGIGRVTALRLAEKGGILIGVGRSPAKCEAVCQAITQSTGNPQVDFLVADLSLQSHVRKLAEEIHKRYDRVNVLVNNAGGFFFRREISREGIEMTLALNHLNYFLLTNLLIDLIVASAPARIVNVSSGAHLSGEIDFEDLECRRRYWGLRAYSQSKLANVLFTYELARRLEGKPVTANVLHPGYVATQFGHNNNLFVRWGIKFSQLIGGRTPEEGARTSVYLASSPEVEGVTGRYYVDSQPRRSSAASYDLEIAKRLWEVSETMTGVSIKTLRQSHATSK
jgi:retinol dehydrogenase 12